MVESPENAEELREMVKKGRNFYVDTYITNDTEIVDIDTEVRDEMSYHNYDSENEWCFKAKEDIEWYIQVLPEASPNNGGVLRLFGGENGELYGGHNEVYPRALKFID